jgi:type II secretory pathway pseudopilin PulG
MGLSLVRHICKVLNLNGIFRIFSQAQCLHVSSRMNPGIRERGFTLLEAIIVVGLIAIIVAVTLPQLTKVLINQRIETSAHRISTSLRFARMSEVKRKIPYQVVINSESASNPNTYALQYKPGASWEIYPDAETHVEGSLTILDSSLDSVIFDARGAATMAGGTNIGLKGTNGAEYRIDVKTTGSVNIVKIASGS